MKRRFPARQWIADWVKKSVFRIASPYACSNGYLYMWDYMREVKTDV